MDEWTVLKKYAVFAALSLGTLTIIACVDGHFLGLDLARVPGFQIDATIFSAGIGALGAVFSFR